MVAECGAQTLPFTVQKPAGPAILRPYRAQTVPAVRLNNSGRLNSLLRAGKLYLTVQDAIALAIENNLGLEIDRYGPLLAQAALERALAGGPIRGVPSASAQVSSVNAGVGVNGSAQSAGLGGGGGGGSGGSSGNAAIQQVGAITPNLDPILQSTTTQAHLTQPQANTVLSQTNALIQSVRTTNTTLQMGLISGGVVQYRNYEQSFKENAPSDLLNPAVGPHMDLTFRHSLLQGFGVKLNDRGIRIAKINTGGVAGIVPVAVAGPGGQRSQRLLGSGERRATNRRRGSVRRRTRRSSSKTRRRRSRRGRFRAWSCRGRRPKWPRGGRTWWSRRPTCGSARTR